MSYTVLPTYQQEGRFVWNRPYRFAGEDRAKGDPVVNVEPRKLRQLLERRMITYAATTSSPGQAGKKGK